MWFVIFAAVKGLARLCVRARIYQPGVPGRVRAWCCGATTSGGLRSRSVVRPIPVSNFVFILFRNQISHFSAHDYDLVGKKNMFYRFMLTSKSYWLGDRL